MDFKSKYLKYKNKYLSLKKMIGGGPIEVLLERYKTVPSAGRTIKIDASYLQFLNSIDTILELNPSLKSKITMWLIGNKDNKVILNASGQSSEIHNGMILKNYVIEKFHRPDSKFMERMRTNVFMFPPSEYPTGYVLKDNCTIEEVMSKPNEELENCRQVNVMDVNGSCLHPSFLETNQYDITDEIKTQWLNVLGVIENKIADVAGKKIIFVIGGTATKNDNTKPENAGTLILYINPCNIVGVKPMELYSYDDYKNYDEVIVKLREGSLANKVLFWRTQFPLSYNKPNSLQVIEKIRSVLYNKIKIINRMCGTCQRSFYFLVKNARATYIVDPEQGLYWPDSENIQKCFADT